MEGATHDSLSSPGLEWENLALYTSKPLHHQFGFSSAPNDSAHEAGGSTTTARADHFGKLGYDDMMRTPDPIIGLRLGHHKQEYAGGSNNPSSSSIPVSSTPTKRSRASYHNMQNPCCQVEGCNLDLKLAKDYHRRHRICESHSKSPKVIVAGLERRFCQQCSRFHDLSEFDDKKRSCRRRLSDHNARRRRVQPESIQLSSAGIISPSLYTDQRQQQNVLLNGLPVSMPNSSWENANSRHAFVRPSKTTLNDDVLHVDPDRLTSLHRSTPRLLDHCGIHLPSSNASMAPELLTSHSLLSSNSWSMNEGESTAMEGISYSPVMRHSESDSHNLSSVFQSNSVIDQGGPPPYMQNTAAAASPHQEYHLFKPPNYHSGNLYSSQRSL